MLIAKDLRTNRSYLLWYINISNFIITCIFPFTLLLYLNVKIWNSLNMFRLRQPSSSEGRTTTNNNKRQADEKQTFTLFAIVFLFAICHILRITLNIDEFIHIEQILSEREIGCPGARFWALWAVSISEIMLQINSGSNFFLYCLFNETFRQELKSQIIRLKLRYQGETSSHATEDRILRENENNLFQANDEIELNDMNL